MNKVVIIGSGLGGLSCGYILQKNGYDVTVLEQGAQTGGCLQSFIRHGVKFETGMHFIGSAAPGQTMDTMLGYLDLKDCVGLSPLDSDAYNTVRLGGENFAFPTGREAFLEKMTARFPKEKESLIKYVEIIDKIAEASSIESLVSSNRDIAANSEYRTRSIDEVMDSLFKDPLLKDVLVGDLPLYSARKGRTPFSLHAFIMDFYNRSSFRVIGGSDAIAKGLVRNITNAGGLVLTGKKAIKIECDSTRATAVLCEDSSIYPADFVISAVHPCRMLEMLQETHLIRPAFRMRINSIPQSSSVFALYVKFKENTVPYLNTNLFNYSSLSPWGCEHYVKASWPESFLYMHMCHQDNAKWARNGVVMAYMNFSDVEQWKDFPVGRRGDAYEEFKKFHALKLIDAVDKVCPGFSASLDGFWTSTPLTYADYTGTRYGSMYGVLKDVTLGPAGRVPYRTRIPNLFLAGQNVNSHGILGVLVGTIVTCSSLLDAESLCSRIFEHKN